MSSNEILNLPLERKRRLYRCQENFVELSSIPTWKELSMLNDPRKVDKMYKVDEELNEKVSLFHGDITTLEIDCIVNATNERIISPLDSRTVDACIGRAGGGDFREVCIGLDGCEIGQAKITGGYNLPARYVIHTVGPFGKKPDQLRSCYRQCFKLMKENGLRTIAFSCISTGSRGYPREEAAHIALKCTRDFLQDNNNAHEVDRIIFCLFLAADLQIYERLMQRYFPSE